MHNNLKLILLFLTLGVFMTSCDKEETTFSDLEPGVTGTVISFTESMPGFFDLADASNSVNSFSFANAELGEDVNSATLTVTYTSASTRMTSNPVVVENVTVDGSYSMSLVQAAELSGVAISALEVGDVFTIGINMSTASGNYTNSKKLNIAVSCASNLAGTYSYEATSVWCGEPLTSGEVTFTEVAAGAYTLDDFSLGGYTTCYSGPGPWGTLQLVDVCNDITLAGEDNYGDTWTYSVDDVSGADLTISWNNTYGESGSAVITRTDGSDWPDLF